MKNNEDFLHAINSIGALIPTTTKEDYDIISGGESRDWVFSYPVAYHLKKSPIGLYKDGRTIGADMKRKRVVHVADLNNEGSSPRDLWIPMIRKAGGIINNIYFYVDRLEEGSEVIKSLGLESNAVVPLNENAWNYLLKNSIINEEIYKSLRERIENKEEWARKMLRSDEGFRQFVAYFKDEKIKAKAEKLLDIGYPDLKDELLKRYTDLLKKYFRGL